MDAKILAYSFDGRVVGWMYQSTQTLYKRVKGSIHRLNQPPGWAWDDFIIQEALAKGMVFTEVIDTETGIVYRAPLEEFTTHGIKLDRKNNPQTVLPLAFWKTSGGAWQEKEPEPAVELEPESPKQLELFG